MPANGLSQRSINRMAGRHFHDIVEVHQWTGKVDEVDQWKVIGTFNGRLLDKSGTSYEKDGVRQEYDAEVIVVSQVSFGHPNSRYRVYVAQTKTRQELLGGPDDSPSLKRERFLEIISCKAQQDNAGTDVFQVLRCKNAVDSWN